MKLRCLVDGKPTDRKSLIRRQMNFGQGCPGLPAHAYRVEVDTNGFLSAIWREFDRLRTELIEDLPYDSESEAVRSLQSLNWPSPEELLRLDARLFAQLLLTYLIQEVLDTLLPHRFEELVAPAYAIDSVSTLQIDPSTLRLEGAAYALSV
jgi:hypothetical protein